MIKKFITAIVLALSTPCMAQTTLNTFFPGTSEGITYHLPDTEIHITVEANCITQTPGEFSSYAERFLHIKSVISQASSRWEITGIDSYCDGVPCKEKAFTVQLGNNTSSNISLNNRGIIQAINTDVPEKTIHCNSATRENRSKKNDASQYMTEEMLTATSTAKMAELTAKEIYAIRESKLAITRVQAENMPNDGAAISILLQELDKQEKALTEMFIGRTDTTYHTYSYTIKHDEVCDTAKAVLFRISHKLGVVDKENLAGEPVYYNIKNLKSVTPPVVDEKTKKKAIKPEGICYNIPGRAKFDIYTRTKTFVEKEIAVAQFGVVEVLSKNLFSKSNNTAKVLFDTATGGVVSIKRD